MYIKKNSNVAKLIEFQSKKKKRLYCVQCSHSLCNYELFFNTQKNFERKIFLRD